MFIRSPPHSSSPSLDPSSALFLVSTIRSLLESVAGMLRVSNSGLGPVGPLGPVGSLVTTTSIQLRNTTVGTTMSTNMGRSTGNQVLGTSTIAGTGTGPLGQSTGTSRLAILEVIEDLLILTRGQEKEGIVEGKEMEKNENVDEMMEKKVEYATPEVQRANRIEVRKCVAEWLDEYLYVAVVKIAPKAVGSIKVVRIFFN